MIKSNKSSYTKNCHPELVSGTTPLVAIQNKEEILKRVQHDNVNNDNNKYVEDPRQNSSGMTALLTTQGCSLLHLRCLACTALSSPSRVEGVPPLGGVGGLSKSISFLEKVVEGRMRGNLRAFTLIELLTAVIIIAVLAAVAVPQYKKAVLKSRFSTVMPKAKAISDAQEVYYLANGEYADNKANLDVEPVAAENTTVEVSGAKENADENYLYVVASRSDIPGARYIQYQKHSPKFAGNIHCEADSTDEEALWLCEKGLQGHEIEGSLQGEEYKTYLLEGDVSNSSNDYFAKACSGSGEKACDCGGPISGSCDDRTGEWEYDTDCPQPLTTGLEADCDKGYTGKKTRVGDVCKNGAYTYGEWNKTNCVADPNTCPGSQPTSSTGVYNCVDGQWMYTRTSGGTNTADNCTGEYATSCSDMNYSGSYKYCRGKAKYACRNSIFSGDHVWCSALSSGSYACSGSTFSGNYSYCEGSEEYACSGSIFSGNGSHCNAGTGTGCKGAIFESGSYCNIEKSNITGACDGTYKPGSWCSSTYHNSYCPAGSPAGTNNVPYSGKCWDGNGHYGTEYCTQS